MAARVPGWSPRARARRRHRRRPGAGRLPGVPHCRRLGARDTRPDAPARRAQAGGDARDNRRARPSARGAPRPRRRWRRVAVDAHRRRPGGRRGRPRPGVRRARVRALLRVRRARDRGRAPRARGRELRRRRAVPGRGAARSSAPWCRSPASARATTRRTIPVPWLLSSRGVGVLIDNAETELLPARHRACANAGASRSSARPRGWPPRPPPDTLAAARLRRSRRRPTCSRRFTARTGRQPEPAAPWVFGPWFQLGRLARRPLAQVAKLRDADAPAVGRPDLHPLSAVRRPRGPAEDERAHVARAARRRRRRHDVLQPDDLRVVHAALRRGRGGGRAHAQRRRARRYVYDYTAPPSSSVGQFDFSTRAGRRALRAASAREAVEDGHDGWMEDFGEYTPLDAFTRDGRTGSAAPQPLCDRLPLRRVGLRRAASAGPSCASSARDGRAPRRCAQVVWNGDPTTDWGFDGLESAVRGGLGMGLSGIAVWGSRHRRLLRARRARAHAGAARSAGCSSARCRASCGRSATAFALPAEDAAADLRRRPARRTGGATPSCARSSTPTSWPPHASTGAAGCRSCGTSCWRIPTTTARAASATTSSCSAPICWSAPVLAPGRHHARALPAARRVDRSLARGRLRLGQRRLRARAAPTRPGRRPERHGARAARRAAAARARRRACSRCCRPTSTRLPTTAMPAPGLVQLRDRALAAWRCWRSRAAARRRRSSHGSACARASGRAAGSCTLGAHATADVRPRRPRSRTLAAAVHALRRRPGTAGPLDTSAWSFDATTGVLRARFTGTRGRLVVRAGC